jgi:phosphatidylserine/phosphatidylglycerophosphate/cardiolipin synthase-like enzyme
MGSKKIDDKLVDRMRQAGVAVVMYRPLRWYTLDRFNNRTHRKLLIVDGRVGFTGGSASPISTAATPRTRSTGATRSSGSRDRR